MKRNYEIDSIIIGINRIKYAVCERLSLIKTFTEFFVKWTNFIYTYNLFTMNFLIKIQMKCQKFTEFTLTNSDQLCNKHRITHKFWLIQSN